MPRGSLLLMFSSLQEHVQCWSLTNDSFLQKTQQQKALFWYLIKCQQAVLNVSNLQHICFRILNTLVMWWGLQRIQSVLGVKKQKCWMWLQKEWQAGSPETEVSGLHYLCSVSYTCQRVPGGHWFAGSAMQGAPEGQWKSERREDEWGRNKRNICSCLSLHLHAGHHPFLTLLSLEPPMDWTSWTSSTLLDLPSVLSPETYTQALPLAPCPPLLLLYSPFPKRQPKNLS